METFVYSVLLPSLGAVAGVFLGSALAIWQASRRISKI